MSAAGLLRGRFLCCEVGLGLRGGREDLKGEGGGIGGRRFYWGLIVFMLCRFSVVLLCVFFNFENRNFVILF